MHLRPILCLLGSFAFAAGSADAAPDILVADFEGGDYGEWTAEGEAFGTGPARGTLPGQMAVSGYEGGGLVNSFLGGDEPTGTLTSPEFTIERPYIKFLVGGGGYEGETEMSLLIDGQPVRKATGPNTVSGGSEELRPRSWSVGDLLGRKARLRIVDTRSGGWGHINVDHIVQSDTPVAAPLRGVAREFAIDRKYLILPVDDSQPNQLLSLRRDGERLREMVVPLAADEPAYWVYLDVSEWPGETLTLQADELRHRQLDSFFDIRLDDTYPGEAALYQEELRPQLHFSTRRGWINDPNGMVHYDGEYHLFYQHNPFGWNWGNMTWGHAVSTDLVHWTELGDALHPDASGTMFSGSGVVDWRNTTGFQTGDEPPLVLAYTSAGGTNPWSEGESFTQGIAYSNDRGRTWTKYAGNPVQGHINGGNRDPKVIWWEETEEWVIVLFLTGKRMAFFRSPDLKRWELQSVIDSFYECPELFELPLQGAEGQSKWVLYGADGSYFLGDFDGSAFKPDGDAIRFHYGDSFYASQTFSDIPEEDGRRIQIAWGRGNATPGMPFNQLMMFPVSLTLHPTAEGPRIFVNPVREIGKLHTERHQFQNVRIPAGRTVPLNGVKGELLDIAVELEIGDAEQVGLEILGKELTYDAANKELRFGGNKAPLSPKDGRVSLRCIVDRTTLEIYANGGRVYMPCKFRAGESTTPAALFARGGIAKATAITIHELESIWKDQITTAAATD